MINNIEGFTEIPEAHAFDVSYIVGNYPNGIIRKKIQVEAYNKVHAMGLAKKQLREEHKRRFFQITEVVEVW